MNKIAKRISAAFMAGVAALALTACSGDKPSKDDVKKGFKKVMVEEMGQEMVDMVGEDALTKYIGCIVDEIYDDVSADTLKAIADGDLDYKPKDDEDDKFEKAYEKCTGELLS